MSLNMNETARPTGARRMSLVMLEARDRADRFQGAEPGTAKPLTYLAAFQEAEPYLGLPAHAFKLVSWLVKQTMAHDWETGSRPVAWPSARRQQEFLCLSPARVKTLNRTLAEAGIVVMRDNEQGKRYGRRGPDKRIIEAFGFDLSPLAQRYQEFVRIAAEAKAERNRMKEFRRRITLARRAIAQAGEMLACSGSPLPPAWAELAAETADLVATARTVTRPEDLALVAKGIESRQAQAEAMVRQAAKAVNPDPSGLADEPHITSTNLSFNPPDTVIVSEKSSRVEAAAPRGTRPHLAPERRSVAGLKRPSQLLELMPRLAQYVRDHEPDWRAIVDAAGGPLRHELGVSPSLWAEACHVLGREAAALALAIVSTKPDSHFTRGAGGYFGGMIRKAEKGELFLERTLWKLREDKWGRKPGRTAH